MQRKRHRLRSAIKLNEIFTPNAIDNAVKLALFLGETMTQAPFVSKGEAIIATANTARKIFVDRPIRVEEPLARKQLRFQLLEARLRRLNPVTDAVRYTQTQNELNNLEDDINACLKD
jgi:hypothetical protein